MFERYTEGSRRAIFFARYEASQTGFSSIETAHLLLGILREGGPFFYKLKITGLESIAEECRRALGIRGDKVPTSVDLPLSNPNKRVLAYAAEEAERLTSTVIGLQHLVLGLLREGDVTAEIMQKHGITIEKLRGVGSLEPTGLTARAGGFTPVPIEFVCDSELVWKTDFSPVVVWPRVGETIFLDRQGSPKQYTVMDVSHFYAVPEGRPLNEPGQLRKIVVTLQPGKPS
jgi:hypothetical protein